MNPQTKAPLQGADIEILERPTSGTSSRVLIPNTVRINGTEIAIPAGARIQIHEISEDEALTVTLTLFARRVTIAAADDDGADS